MEDRVCGHSILLSDLRLGCGRFLRRFSFQRVWQGGGEGRRSDSH